MFTSWVIFPRRKFALLVLFNAFFLFIFIYHLPRAPSRSKQDRYSSLELSTPNLESQQKSHFSKPLTDLSSKQLQIQLLAQAKNLSSTPFPKLIHQTWKNVPLPNIATDRQKSWIENNPSHQYSLLTDDMALEFVTKSFDATDPYIVYLYKNFPQRILAADLLRYLMIYQSGGLYVDIDTICYTPIDQWLPKSLANKPDINLDGINLVVGMELDVLDTKKYPDSWIKENRFLERIQFLQWSIYAKPGHEVLRRMISSIQETIREDISNQPWWKRKDISSIKYNQMKVLSTTGPFGWTKVIMEYVNDIEGRKVDLVEYSGIKDARRFGDVLFLPVNKWSPGVAHSEAGKIETSFLIHYYGASWKTNLS
ncbi:membrane-bound alpha-1,6- mannosyltransferase Initiation-specific [Orbilia ellipsospora]|uniref:Membrane-bound alpha-1,6- mannosyltransferase Initiation-specific n=1 Tax=Orbilia ellipsospora TaxID=2528407 RepID=A0AAV9XKF6_9PEZI